MSAMTVPAVLALISAGNCIPPSVQPIVVGIAQHESGLDPTATHRNPNGTTDYGLGMINSSNFLWLSASLKTAVNETTIFDPCLNARASLAVLLVKYNGNAPPAVKAAYAAGVTARIRALDGVPAPTKEEPIADPTTIYAKPSHSGRDLVFSR